MDSLGEAAKKKEFSEDMKSNRDSQPLHINQTLRLPPRPVGSTLETTTIPGNESKENITTAKNIYIYIFHIF